MERPLSPGDVPLATTSSSFNESYGICFGSICDAPIRCVLQLFNAPEGVRELPVLPKPSCTSKSSWFGLQLHGKLFAVLSKKFSLGFHDLLDKADVQLRAVIDLKQVEYKTKSLKREHVESMTIDVNVYGQREDAELTGNVLSSLGLYLQQPILQRNGTRYYNPHFFHMDEISETPIFELDYGASEYQPLGNSDADSSMGTGQDSSEDVSSILNSLTQITAIGKRAGDTGLVTVLKDHQMQALDFVFLRETLTNLPEKLKLWKRHNIGEHEFVYQHRIMGTERHEPWEIRGGLIADEMGLGKTMIMLANIVGSLNQAQVFVSRELKQPGLSPGRKRTKATLVVVPSSILIDSWLEEIQRHIKHEHISVFKYHGSGRQDLAHRCFESDIVLTTYKTIVTELQTSRVTTPRVLDTIEWFRIILDEAHDIRNRATKQFQAVASLSSEQRWCMTGTPIQNSLEDLSSLIGFLRVPMLENPATFRKYIAQEDKAGARHRFTNLRLLLDSICLRRTRKAVGLPEPDTEVQELSFTATERQVYNDILDHISRRIDLGVSGHAERSTPILFQAILQLRLFCNHGRIYSSASAEDDLEDVLNFLQQNDDANCVFCSRAIYSINDRPDTDGGCMISPCKHLSCRSCFDQVMPQARQTCPACAAGETETTVENVLRQVRIPGFAESSSPNASTEFPSKLLKFVDDVSQHTHTKSIVFSYWKKTLDLVGKMLLARNIRSYFIHGAVAHSERRRVLADFRSHNGHSILLMTLGTGAVGLNLAVASRIYLLEPQWNPSLEQQAFGRAQRLGQTEKVTIIRYIMKETIEDGNVRSRQVTKMHIASGGFPQQHVD